MKINDVNRANAKVFAEKAPENGETGTFIFLFGKKLKMSARQMKQQKKDESRKIKRRPERERSSSKCSVSYRIIFAF